MDKIVILHFSPLELYPPVQNLIRVLENSFCGKQVYIFTTRASTSSLTPFECKDSNVKIKRLGKSGNGSGFLQRLFTYGWFYGGCCVYLVLLKPRKLLYFETLSAFPAWFYKKFINTKVAILIHYHEYTTTAGYASGMWLTNKFHRLEKWLYPKAVWVSHTNQTRMYLFQKDLLPVTISHPQILPNYPPKAWHIEKSGTHSGDTISIVYTGALSLDTMYTTEFATFILSQQGQLKWHIYSHNITAEATAYLQGLKSPWIQLFHGVDYEALPVILRNYDVGVILYNGHIPNYIHNAPNKLFEYLACGLQVWYPDVMEGIHTFKDETHEAAVTAVDFNKLKEFAWQDTIIKTGHTNSNKPYTSQHALAPVVKMLCS